MPTFKAGEAGEYLDAVNRHNAAIRKFEAAKAAFRAVKPTKETINIFLAARTAYEAATAEFDVAFSKESNRG